MTDMIERVARAIAAAAGAGAEKWYLYECEASAAIEALRDPTPGMLFELSNAVCKRVKCRCDHDPLRGELGGCWIGVEEGYKAMIDAVLEES